MFASCERTRDQRCRSTAICVWWISRYRLVRGGSFFVSPFLFSGLDAHFDGICGGVCTVAGSGPWCNDGLSRRRRKGGCRAVGRSRDGGHWRMLGGSRRYQSKIPFSEISAWNTRMGADETVRFGRCHRRRRSFARGARGRGSGGCFPLFSLGATSKGSLALEQLGDIPHPPMKVVGPLGIFQS